MNQGYFLSTAYLLVCSLLLLQEKYRQQLAFMLRMTLFLKTSRKGLGCFTALGVLTFLLLMAFPVAPGPQVLGDLIPALFVLYESLFFQFTYFRRDVEKDTDYLDLKKNGRRALLGWISLGIAVIHFLVPSLVLL